DADAFPLERGWELDARAVEPGLPPRRAVGLVEVPAHDLLFAPDAAVLLPFVAQVLGIQQGVVEHGAAADDVARGVAQSLAAQVRQHFVPTLRGRVPDDLRPGRARGRREVVEELAARRRLPRDDLSEP